MIEQRPTIADIQTTELIYFDKDFNNECYQFCINREIDCLPAHNDASIFYQRNVEKNIFDRKRVTRVRKIDAATFIFRQDLLVRFKEHPLLFVCTNGELTGVVHFSDYNKSIVNTFLFAQIARYERDLRALLKVNDLKNSDMIEFFNAIANRRGKDKEKRKEIYERKLREFEEKKEKLSNLDEFQSIYLIDLISLANSKKVIKLNDDVNNLRNTIMHSVDTVLMNDARTADYIYEFDTFEKLFNRARLLLNDGRRIHNRASIQRSLSDKLEKGSK